MTGGYVYRGLQNVGANGTYLYGDYCTGVTADRITYG